MYPNWQQGEFKASDIECPTDPDFCKIWKFVKILIKNYISENLIKKYIDIFAVFKITKSMLKITFKVSIAPLRGADDI